MSINVVCIILAILFHAFVIATCDKLRKSFDIKSVIKTYKVDLTNKNFTREKRVNGWLSHVKKQTNFSTSKLRETNS